VISVDTKKKELVGDFRNNGREYRPQGNPEAVRVHDFLIKELVHRVIQVIHKGIGICNIAPWLGDWGHGTTNLCGVERG